MGEWGARGIGERGARSEEGGVRRGDERLGIRMRE